MGPRTVVHGSTAADVGPGTLAYWHIGVLRIKHLASQNELCSAARLE